MEVNQCYLNRKYFSQEQVQQIDNYQNHKMASQQFQQQEQNFQTKDMEKCLNKSISIQSNVSIFSEGRQSCQSFKKENIEIQKNFEINDNNYLQQNESKERIYQTDQKHNIYETEHHQQDHQPNKNKQKVGHSTGHPLSQTKKLIYEEIEQVNEFSGLDIDSQEERINSYLDSLQVFPEDSGAIYHNKQHLMRKISLEKVQLLRNNSNQGPNSATSSLAKRRAQMFPFKMSVDTLDSEHHINNNNTTNKNNN